MTSNLQQYFRKKLIIPFRFFFCLCLAASFAQASFSALNQNAIAWMLQQYQTESQILKAQMELRPLPSTPPIEHEMEHELEQTDSLNIKMSSTQRPATTVIPSVETSPGPDSTILKTDRFQRRTRNR